jgi:hypothetical protein
MFYSSGVMHSSAKGPALVDPGAALAITADGATAVAAAFNAAWLARMRLAGAPHARRRLAAATLVLLNAGIAVQAAFALALFSTRLAAAPADPFFAAGPWLASRVTLLAATLLLSTLILRRWAR